LNLVEQVPTNGTQSSNRKAATDAYKLINGIRRHIKDDHCHCCKAALLNIFFAENNVAGSTGDQAIKPAADTTSTTDEVLIVK
jgi:hypothetical protein